MLHVPLKQKTETNNSLTDWGSSKYSCLAKTQPHFLVALMDCSRTSTSQPGSQQWTWKGLQNSW